MPNRAEAANSRGYGLLCTATVFVSSFLLFLLEPLFAKMILPLFGGSASVWATCLVFFQTALLLGYAYADASNRFLTPKIQVILHSALIVAAVFALHLSVTPGAHPSDGQNPFWRMLLLLAASIGLPYMMLSATSPLVQSWYARVHGAGAEPYGLFALSNFASFLALLSYPFLLEPRTTTRSQAVGWSVLFGVFVILCAATAWFGLWRSRAGNVEAREAAGVALSRKVLWFLLSACGSMQLLTVTNHLTQNVTPVPLLWVLPLAIYLLTFTFVFGRRSLYQRPLFIRLLAVFLSATAYALYDIHAIGAIQVAVPIFCIGLFICCMFCHGELNRMKPGPEGLTEFYLILAAGGAAGSIFVGLVAPQIFSSLYEFPITLALTAVLALVCFWPGGWIVRALWACVVTAMLLVLSLNVRSLHRHSLLMARSFYGALRVTESRDFGGEPARLLYHGTIRHGAQYRNLPWRKMPTTYYSRDSGIGIALRYCCSASKRVGVVGLGAGTLAVYGQDGDTFRFYEINPQVTAIAQNVFTYLRESPARIEIATGDARLSLAQERPHHFDVLAIDAFSGDAIPVHLLTRQAFELYLSQIQPNGILAVHTSNTYLALNPVVAKLAESFGLSATLIKNEADDDQCIASSDWVLVTRNQEFLQLPMVQKSAVPIASVNSAKLWTDDYNNLFEILKPINLFKR